MPALSYSITISDEESAYLKSLIKTRTIQAQVVDRARILLWKSEAKTDKAIADGLGISVNTVRRCIDRYLNGGINLAIFDNDRSGRPVEITDDAMRAIAKKAAERKTGARGLRTVVEEALSDIMFDAPSDDTISKVILTGECVTDGKAPEVIRDPSARKNRRNSEKKTAKKNPA